eukprot:TRINITY_DN112577_c0_g1_i1.p1 TRINITY_DN112577_c0_g1~~TRINITY_DN112577_c0_g1_i1.p1  ORF type:complete len:386 (-),score=75.30 TRINITY_DN112577_c0_g1_i1:106-1263(-)
MDEGLRPEAVGESEIAIKSSDETDNSAQDSPQAVDVEAAWEEAQDAASLSLAAFILDIPQVPIASIEATQGNLTAPGSASDAQQAQTPAAEPYVRQLTSTDASAEECASLSLPQQEEESTDPSEESEMGVVAIMQVTMDGILPWPGVVKKYNLEPRLDEAAIPWRKFCNYRAKQARILVNVSGSGWYVVLAALILLFITSRFMMLETGDGLWVSSFALAVVVLFVISTIILRVYCVTGMHKQNREAAAKLADSIRKIIEPHGFSLLVYVHGGICYMQFKLPPFDIERSPVVLDVYNVEAEEAVDCDDCAICLECYEQDDRIAFLPCRHRFHEGCVSSWLNRDTVCPLCKQDIWQASEDNSKLSPPEEDVAAGGEAVAVNRTVDHV